MTLDIDRLVDGIHEYMGRALQPLADRIKKLEEDARGSAAGEVTEHKFNRHSEHLARLETRLQTLERRLKQYETEATR